MKKEAIEQCLFLAAKIGREQAGIQPYEIAKNIAKLQKIASSLHKRYEADCSYQWADTEEYRARTERLELHAGEIVELLGTPKIKLKLQRYPRGWPIQLTFADGQKICLL